MSVNFSPKKVLTGFVMLFLTSCATYIVLVGDYYYRDVTAPAALPDLRSTVCDGKDCGHSHLNQSNKLRLLHSDAKDFALLNSSYRGKNEGSVRVRYGGKYRPWNRVGSAGVLNNLRADKTPIRTSLSLLNGSRSTQITSKLRFEKKLSQLGPPGKAIVYDRNNLPPELMQLAPSLFSAIPRHFLPDYKSPCWRGSEGALKCLPYFFIGGFPKCATTDLWGKLTTHPDIVKTLKEPQWWTRTTFSAKAIEKYLSIESTVAKENEKQHRKDLINCDASALTFMDNKMILSRMPEYLRRSVRYITADVIRAVLPDARFVGIVRNPTERAYSAYMYFDKRERKSPRDFHKKTEMAIREFYRCTDQNSLKQCAYQNIAPLHVNTGCYSLYIRQFMQRFPREQLYFLRSKDWSSDPLHNMAEIYAFLGIDMLSNSQRERAVNSSRRLNVNARKSRARRPAARTTLLPETRRMLDEFYRPCNEDLARILHDDRYLWKS